MISKFLDENLRQSAQNLDLGWRFTFQQDYDSKHTSKLVTVWLQKNNSAIIFVWKENCQSLCLEGKLSVSKIPSASRMCSHCSNLTRNFRKQLQQVIKIRGLLMTINIIKIVQFFQFFIM